MEVDDVAESGINDHVKDLGLDRKIERNRKILTYTTLIGLAGGSAYKVGEYKGKKEAKDDYEETLSKAVEGMKRFERSEAMGNKGEQREYRISFDRPEGKVDTIEYRPIPMKQLKSEQAHYIQAIKSNRASFDWATGVGYGALVGMETMFLMYMCRKFLNKKIATPAATLLAKSENAAIDGFKKASDFISTKTKTIFKRKPTDFGMDD